MLSAESALGKQPGKQAMDTEKDHEELEDSIDEDSLSRESSEADSAPGNVPSDDAPIKKRGRGRPKGSVKPPGSGRKHFRDKTRDDLRKDLLQDLQALVALAQIARGEKFFSGSGGPAGKDSWRRPSIQQRLRAIELVLSKCLPDLQSTELTGAEGKDLIPAPQLDTRETAIAVLSLMRDSAVRERGRPDIPIFAYPQPLAGVIDHKQHLEPAPSELEPAPAAAAPVTPAVEPKREYQVGETEVFDNGAYIQLVEIAGSNERKWDIRDELNAPYGYSRDRQAAVTRARALKRAGEQG